MAVRARSRKRLLIILLGAFVVVGGLAGAVMYGKHRAAAQSQAAREAGMTAHAAGQYQQATKSLSEYLDNNSADLEALRAFADSLLTMRYRNPGSTGTAIATLRKIRELDRDDDHARRELMKLYARHGQYTEAIELADRFLESDPRDVQALRVKGATLAQLRRFGEAMTWLEKAAEMQPLNMEIQGTIIEVMRQRDQSDEQLLTYVQQLRDAHPDDPRTGWLMALAHSMVGEREAALQAVRAAAEQDIQSPDTVWRLVRMLDSLQQFPAGTALLNDHIDRMLEPKYVTFALKRLWEVGNRRGVRSVIEGLAPDNPALSVEVVGLAAMNLPTDADAAEPWLAELEARAANGERMAEAWRAVVASRNESVSGERFVEICRSALRVNENHPYFRGWLGEALARRGQAASALEEWRAAAEGASAWYMPHVRSARVLMGMNATRQAIQHALAAVRRAPNRLDTVSTFLEIRVGLIDSADDPAYETVREDVRRLIEQRLIPSLVPQWMRLVAMSGDRADLAEQLNRLLDQGEQLPAGTLLEVEQIVRDVDADLAARVDRYLDASHSGSADVIWRRAIARARDGQVEAGRKMLEQRRANADESDRLGATIDLLRYDEMTRDQTVAERWYELSEQYPDRRVAHESAIRSDDAWSDLQRMRSVIDRLGEATGEDSIEYRIAMSRWLLAQETEVARDSAIEMLKRVTRAVPSLLRPRIMLVEAHRQQGNNSAMIDNLAVAVSLAPERMDLKFAFAGELIRLGDQRRAERVIDRLAEQVEPADERSRRLAELLARVGQPDRAIDRLVTYHEGDALAPDTLLADLYARTGRIEQADAVVEALLDEQRVDSERLRFAADYFGRTNRIERGEAVLDRLDQRADLTPGVPAFIRAAFYASHVGPEPAIAELRRGIEQAPERMEMRQTLVVYLLRLGRIDAALDAAERTRDLAADPPAGIQRMLAHRDVIRQVAEATNLYPLIRVIVESDEQAEPAAEALGILAAAPADDVDEATTARLRQLANRHPNLLPLQTVLIQRYMAAGDAQQASELASEALQRFRDAVEPAYLAAEAFSAAGRWSDALNAAREWRRRSGRRIPAADLMMAEAQMRLGENDDAVALTRPYLQQALENPENNYRIIINHARALIALERHEAAADLLQPLLQRGARWEGAWLNLAAFAIQDAAVAERWLARITDAPAEAPMQRMNKARAWFALHQRTDDAAHRRRAIELMQPVIQAEDAPAEALSLAGTIFHTAGDAERAEQLYRRALAADDLQPTPQNNLAMLILERDGDPAEALKLARQAIKSAPNAAPIHDTIALAYQRLGEPEAALEAIRQAVELQPDTPEWRITLADILIDDNQLSEARRQIDELRRSFMGFVEDDSRVARRIRDLEQALAEAGGMAAGGES